MTDRRPDPGAELAAQRKRLAQLRGLLTAGEAKATADAEVLLPGRTTSPRTRQQVEKELETFTAFDGPMLREQIDQAERVIAGMEAARQTERPPLAILVPRGDPASELERRRGKLGELHDQRRVAVARVMDMSRAVHIAVSRHEQDGASERRRLQEAIDTVADLDRQIDQVGAAVKRGDAAELRRDDAPTPR